jgi:hypothetical protein
VRSRGFECDQALRREIRKTLADHRPSNAAESCVPDRTRDGPSSEEHHCSLGMSSRATATARYWLRRRRGIRTIRVELCRCTVHVAAATER